MIDINDAIKSTRVMWGMAVVIKFITLINGKWNERVYKHRKLSYSIYVVHWPIIESFSSRFYILLSTKGDFSHVVVFRINLVLTFGLIICSSHSFNKYIENIGGEVIQKMER